MKPQYLSDTDSIVIAPVPEPWWKSFLAMILALVCALAWTGIGAALLSGFAP